MSEGEFVNVRPFIPNKKVGKTDENSDAFDTVDWVLKNVINNNSSNDDDLMKQIDGRECLVQVEKRNLNRS